MYIHTKPRPSIKKAKNTLSRDMLLHMIQIALLYQKKLSNQNISIKTALTAHHLNALRLLEDKKLVDSIYVVVEELRFFLSEENKAYKKR